MIPDLLEATQDFWHKLDELEAAYQQGEVSLEEVDDQVAELIADLSQSRRVVLRRFWDSIRYSWQMNPEPIIGVVLLGSLTCAWLVLNPLA